MDENLLNFLRSQKVIVLATVGDDGKPWMTNIFYAVNDSGRTYFISDKKENIANIYRKIPKSLLL